jgi:7-cyano-7-deazaguanine synthase in queuosine biosynthesis
VTAVQLFSGGLDSLCLWYLTGQPMPVYVTVGARYERHEIDTIWKLCSLIPKLSVTVIPGPNLGFVEAADGHIPHRNLLLAATASARFPSADTVLLGALRGEASPDKSPAFTRAASRVLTASENKPVRVVAPARRLTKTGLVRRFAHRFPEAVPLLQETRSCYSADSKPCGECQACFRRNVALFHAGLAAMRPCPPATPLRAGLRTALAAGPHRWPDLAFNNLQAAAAVAGVRWPGP